MFLQKEKAKLKWIECKAAKIQTLTSSTLVCASWYNDSVLASSNLKGVMASVTSSVTDARTFSKNALFFFVFDFFGEKSAFFERRKAEATRMTAMAVGAAAASRSKEVLILRRSRPCRPCPTPSTSTSPSLMFLSSIHLSRATNKKRRIFFDKCLVLNAFDSEDYQVSSEQAPRREDEDRKQRDFYLSSFAYTRGRNKPIDPDLADVSEVATRLSLRKEEGEEKKKKSAQKRKRERERENFEGTHFHYPLLLQFLSKVRTQFNSDR